MNDPKIRESFKKLYLKRITEPCLIYDELGLSGGDAIADLAAISPKHLEGFEIKSAQDTLARLPNQIKVYNQVFHYINIITEEAHLSGVEKLVPDFWGIILCQEIDSGEVEFQYKRLPSLNPNFEIAKQVELLWKTECHQLLYEVGVRGISKLRKKKLWELLITNCTPQQLINYIYITLKRRIDWKKSLI